MKALIVIGTAELGGPWQFETGDGVFLAGSVDLREGDQASSAKIQIADPRLELANTLPLPQSNAHVPFEAYLGEPAAPTKVFAGYVSSLEANALPGRLEIMAVDKAKGLRRVERARNLTDTSAGALIRRLAEEDGLTVDLTQAAALETLTFAEVLQAGESNWEVMGRLLEQTGHTWHVRGSTVYVRPLGTPREGVDPLELRLGQDVANGFSFTVDELTRSTTPNLVTRSGEPLDISQRGVLAVLSGLEGDFFSSPPEDSEPVERVVSLRRSGLLFASADQPSYDDQALQEAMRAQARAKELFRARLPLVRAYPDRDVDDQVVLLGAGDRFSSVWNISAVRHDLVTRRTSLDCYNGGGAV